MRKLSLIIILIIIGAINSFAQSTPISGDGFHYYGPNTTWGEYLKVGGNGRGTTKASVVSTNGNLHLDSKDGRQTYINHYSKGNTYLNTQGGNVGIGITNPGAKFHVSEGVQLRKTTIGLTKATADNSWIRDEWLTGSYGPAKWNQDKKKWVRPAGAYNDIGGIVYQDEGTYFLREGLGTKLEYTNTELLNTAFMFAHITTGNIGLGTTTPTTKLDVNGFAKFNNTSSAHSNIQLGHDSNDKVYADNSTNKYYGGGLFFRVTSDPSLNISSNYIDVMTLSDRGDVGIGTNDTKGYKLGVNGKIAATEVKVALYNTWPDYVFEKAYKLPTLQEVENHIETKGHLINIPTASEVAENGIQLGEMNSKLLEKIEELTLYTIAQEKKLDEADKEFQASDSRLQIIETKNQILEERLAKLEALLLKK